MSTRRRVVALVAATAVGGAGLLSLLLTSGHKGESVANVGAQAPAIDLPDVRASRARVVLAELRGTPVLVNFWATWCEPCKSEMPALQQLADGLKDRPFILYSVDLQEDASQVEAFQRQYNLQLYAVLDENGDVTRAYGVRALPSTFVVDKAGVLRLQRLGPLVTGDANTSWSEAWLADQVRSLL